MKRKKVMRAWLIHKRHAGDCFLHWLIVAPSIELAYEQALELPGPRQVPALLGAVIEELDWADFARKPIAQSCHICNDPGVIMLSNEEKMWASWLAGKPAITFVPHKQERKVLQ
jgi:hypothetical protein